MRKAFDRVGRLIGLGVCLWVMTLELRGGIVIWDGGGGDGLWQTAANWSGDVLPGAADDVILSAAGGASVSITNTLQTTLKSLQSSNSLVQSGGSLRLTSGNSRVDAPLSLLGNTLVTIAGTGSVLTVQSSFSMAGGTLQAVSGGRAVFSTLTTYAKPAGCATVIWKADGTGSRFEFPALLSLDGADCAALQIEAFRGAEISLPQLTTLIEGQTLFLCDGAGSLISLPLLDSVTARLRSITFEARNLGRIDYPGFTGSPMAVVNRRSGGVLSIEQLTELKGLVIGGESAHFPLLTKIGNAGITVESGATVSLSNLTTHVPGNTCETPVWLATGNGSRLRLPVLTKFAGPDCGAHLIRALAGGVIEIPKLAVIEPGSLTVIADAPGSRVELPVLDTCLSSPRTVAFEVKNAGEVQIPQLRGGDVVTVALGTGGVLPVAQLTQLKGFSVDAMPVEFPSLVQVGTANITVSGGGTASAPKLVSHIHPTGCVGTIWSATGNGSRLDLSPLVDLTGATCGALTVRATAGATVDLGGLLTLSEGVLGFLSEGTNSLIYLPKLQEAAKATRPVSFEARNSGVLAMPVFQGGPAVSVTIRSGGTLDAAQMTLLKSMLVSGTRLTVPGVTHLFAGSLIVEEGGDLSFPNLVEHSHGNVCSASFWTASGVNSRLDLTQLIRLEGPSCGALAIQALGGGQVAMNNLERVTEGRLDVLADGTNSIVNLASLQRSDATRREVLFEARNQGRVLIPKMGGGPTVGITIRSNGVITSDQLGWLGSLSVSQASIDLPSVTNLNSGSLAATDGSIISLPGLKTYQKDRQCLADSWTARGAGSAIRLPGLAWMSGGDCLPLTVEATSGGEVSLSALTNIESGWVKMLADGSGSVLRFPMLGNFVDAEKRSSLVTTNAGRLDLGSAALVTSGVQLDLFWGTSNVLPVQLSSDQLILHGRAWHSYRVDRYGLPSATTTPELYARIPLLQDFQVIGPAAGPEVGFLATEFVMDPPGLELTALPGIGVGKVVFGPPGKSYNLLGAGTVDTARPWEWVSTVTLTNSFSILPNEPLSIPQRYFQLEGPIAP